MMMKIAFLLALLVPPLLGVPLVLADHWPRLSRLLDGRGDWLLAAIVVGLLGWLQP